MRLPANMKARTAFLWGLLWLQSLCAAFYLYDAVSDSLASIPPLPLAENVGLEAFIVAALIFGLGFTAVELRRMSGHQRRMEHQLKAASGAFLDLLEEYFEAWGLTPSERDVALLSIKGFAISDMARIRNTKDGTIKAQCNAIYRKAGVNGRPQLLSLFIDEMMNNDDNQREQNAHTH